MSTSQNLSTVVCNTLTQLYPHIAGATTPAAHILGGGMYGASVFSPFNFPNLSNPLGNPLPLANVANVLSMLGNVGSGGAGSGGEGHAWPPAGAAGDAGGPAGPRDSLGDQKMEAGSEQRAG
jgi:hypothetical protein